MTSRDTIDDDATAIALQALAWTLGDDARAGRLLALTGLEPEGIRARIGDPAMLGAVLAFLESHEPDLIACADAIGVKPQYLIAAQQRLNA
ncbi:MAG: DUF3572 domain-containing protein [Pseudomonadota bacterium]